MPGITAFPNSARFFKHFSKEGSKRLNVTHHNIFLKLSSLFLSGYYFPIPAVFCSILSLLKKIYNDFYSYRGRNRFKSSMATQN